MNETVLDKQPNSMEEAPLVEGNHNFSTITEKISSIVESKPPSGWLIAFLFSFSLLLMLKGTIGYLIWEGTGIWGLNSPVGWGFAIVNFVFWVGKKNKKFQNYFWNQLSKVVEKKFFF